MIILQRLSFVTLLLAASFLNQVSAQQPIITYHPNYSTWSATVNYGSTVFFGDIKQYRLVPVTTYNNELRAGMGVAINKQLTSSWGVNLNVLDANLAGTKRTFNEYFNAHATEFSSNLTFNLTNLCNKSSHRKFKLYATAGLGLINFRNVTRTLTTRSFISSYGYNKDGLKRGGATTEVVVPVGLGAKYKLNDFIDLGLEVNLKNVNSDKLDGLIGGKYNDRYTYTSISLTYKFRETKYFMEWISPDDKKKIDAFLVATHQKGRTYDTLLTIYFEPKQFEIDLSNEIKMLELVKKLNENPTSRVKVIGYVDVNSEDKRLPEGGEICALRATEAVKILIEKYKINKDRIIKRKMDDVMDYPLTLEKEPQYRKVNFILVTDPTPVK